MTAPTHILIAGLDPAIHACLGFARAAEEWIAGSSPAMTVKGSGVSAVPFSSVKPLRLCASVVQGRRLDPAA
jgi:hypothetical protein